MKKNELRTGDLIVNRAGYLGVVILVDGINDYILYQTIGYDMLDLFNDDLTDADEYQEGDIMEVHRDVTFYDLDHEDENLVWQREAGWVRPTEKERKAMQEKRELERQKMVEEMRRQEEKAKNRKIIHIVSQAFYGNRTGTSIDSKDLDAFVLGYLDDRFPVSEPIDRTVIHVPGTDNLVFIYNKYQEERQLALKKEAFETKGYVMKPLAEIPEMDIRIYSRCIACRMNADGNPESLQKEDYAVVMKYFTK